MGKIAVGIGKPLDFVAYKTGLPDYWQIYKFDKEEPGILVYRIHEPLAGTIFTSEARALDIVDELTAKKTPHE